MKRASIAIGKRKPTDHCRIELSLVRATPQMPKVIMDTKAAERAERLRLIRKRLHKIKTQRQMAAVLGVPITPTIIGNVACRSRPPKPSA